MTESQAQQIIALLERIVASNDNALEAIRTLAAGLNTNMSNLSSSVEDIEQSVGQIVTLSEPGASL